MRREFINQSNFFFFWGVEVSVLYLNFLLVRKAMLYDINFRYWEPTYEDSLNLIARVPVVAAYVYQR